MQSEELLLSWKNGFGRKVAEFHQTGREASSIGFSLIGPKHGWLFFALDLGEGGRFVCRASSVPNDFLGELAEALLAFLSGVQQVSISMHGEPDTFVIRLGATEDGNTRFELHYRRSFESQQEDLVWGVTTVGTSICESLVELILDYGKSLDKSQYSSDMGWEFPSSQLERLQFLCTPK